MADGWPKTASIFSLNRDVRRNQSSAGQVHVRRTICAEIQFLERRKLQQLQDAQRGYWIHLCRIDTIQPWSPTTRSRTQHSRPFGPEQNSKLTTRESFVIQWKCLLSLSNLLVVLQDGNIDALQIRAGTNARTDPNTYKRTAVT